MLISTVQTSVGIDSFPTELLEEILALAAVNDPPIVELGSEQGKENVTPEIHHRLGWITATHVCRRWRATALAISVLWTRLLLNMGSDWVDRMLERAGPTNGLSVIINTKWPATHRTLCDTLEAIVPLMNRVEHFELCVPEDGSSALQDFNLVFQSIPAPRLKSLNFMDLDQWDFFDTVPLGAINDDTIFARHTPVLSTLTFHGIFFFELQYCLFSKLKRLEGHSFSTQPYPEYFLLAFKRMPLLEVLVLTGEMFAQAFYNPWDGPDPELPDQPIELPNLRILEIAGIKPILDFFRSYLTLPSSCVVTEHVLPDRRLDP